MLPLLLGGWLAQPPAAARPASGAPHSVPAPALNPVVEAQSFRAPFTAVNPFSGTHQLEHWELFQDYLKLYENTLSEWLDEKGASLREFYEKVQDVKERSTDPKEQEFIHCLLASCDYDSFYSVMVREADRQSAMERLQVSAPAESKSEGKGGDDDDDEELDVKGSGAKDAK